MAILVACVALTSAGCSQGIKAFMEAAARAFGPEPPVAVSITQYGIAEVEYGEGLSSAPTTTTGVVREVVRTRYTAATNRIPATLGTTFGVRYVVSGRPEGTRVPLEMRTIHPPLTNPGTGQVTTESLWLTDAWVGGDSGRTYTLEYEWEVVPGDWSFEIYHEGALVAKQDFVLYDPSQE